MTSADTVHFRNDSEKTVMTYMYTMHSSIKVYFREITFIVFTSIKMIKSQHVWCSMLSCLADNTKLKKNKTSKSIFSLVNSIQCDGHNHFFLLWKYVGTFHVKCVIWFVHRKYLELNSANCWSFSVKSMPPPPCFWPSSSMWDVSNEN